MSYLNGVVGFCTFFNFSLILAIRSYDLSHSQLSVLFLLVSRVSLSSSAKNIINLILVLTIW